MLHPCISFIPHLSRNLLKNFSVFQNLCKALGSAFVCSKMKWFYWCNKILSVQLFHVVLLKLLSSKVWLKALLSRCREMLQMFWLVFIYMWFCSKENICTLFLKAKCLLQQLHSCRVKLWVFRFCWKLKHKKIQCKASFQVSDDKMISSRCFKRVTAYLALFQSEVLS